MIDRLAQEQNRGFAVITHSFSHRGRARECSEMNQPDGDIHVCWFPILVLASLSQSPSKKPTFHSNCFLQKALRVLFICFRIRWVSISSRPIAPTLSNGIACHEGRTCSRSGKCSARVVHVSLIDASLAPMSERMEASAAESVRALSRLLQSPWN